jgi:hypothetical protein
VATLVIIELHLGILALTTDVCKLHCKLTVSTGNHRKFDLLGHLGQRSAQAHEPDVDILQPKQRLWLRHVDSPLTIGWGKTTINAGDV